MARDAGCVHDQKDIKPPILKASPMFRVDFPLFGVFGCA